MLNVADFEWDPESAEDDGYRFWLTCPTCERRLTVQPWTRVSCCGLEWRLAVLGEPEQKPCDCEPGTHEPSLCASTAHLCRGRINALQICGESLPCQKHEAPDV